MKLKRYLWLALLLAAIVLSLLPAYSQQVRQLASGFQVSTLGALNLGVYEGAATFAQLKQHGDFGLGTVDGLDGELVGLDGKFYYVKTDGVAYPVADQVKTPFATVAFFHTEDSLRLNGQMNYLELQQQIDARLPTENLPYAIRIRGNFPYLKVRSVPKQSPPYLPLSDVVSQQAAIFELRNVRGTLVGFRMPQYLKGVNVAGYHFHFITSDRTSGGHLLDGELLDSRVDIETLRDWQMMLPDNTAFKQASLE
ncbi:MAG: Alpha-acetolactate decarboxylase [Chroococcidiopsis cubana SAG 39.79]|uniref:Alpha-acetolactate decarboxylase n=1 Tax=Chroococcidiopsis cubana SAG 39.79 TaxID=388085 RepID=A0AB37U8X9_9CYAN|nr:acetolactate decarboxylase [Chroococcidiopsis cubana]MDZ4877619.1 Alpha-acetolactate decarboxylase [Chroococcidiopsis cubana SAG 39.79]PSB62130.1 acetolactate decarboxylase [Chroococcidiopsis cubana CCALA 043]RUT00884.1 alpha-acetolactate decarboxylase [Chroococcidiopsis cubana SAG 39.79]